MIYLIILAGDCWLCPVFIALDNTLLPVGFIQIKNDLIGWSLDLLRWLYATDLYMFTLPSINKLQN